MSVRWLLPGLVLVAGCATGSHLLPLDSQTTTTTVADADASGEATTVPEVTAASTTTTTQAPIASADGPAPPTAYGRVLSADGVPLAGATVDIGGVTAVTDDNGWYVIDGAVGQSATVSRPAWVPVEAELDGAVSDLTIEPFVVRGIRANRVVFLEEGKWENILSLADQTAVNTIVFDTKDESGQVLYDSAVPLAAEIGALNVVYDPAIRIAEAREHDLYTITRIVTFEDDVWADSGDAQIVGTWVDARNEENWAYPIALGVEACELGFDEVQFDYVRFPAGQTGGDLNRREGLTQEIRVGAIEGFLATARQAISPLGCAVSADVFAIVMSSPHDQGIGQRPEELSQHLDAISPMIYPSHYGNGWLGFSDPNDHNAEVTANALDDGAPRIADNSLMRPWLQAFYYNAGEVLEGIYEAEARGYGWMLWNANGNYELAWLPTDADVASPTADEDG